MPQYRIEIYLERNKQIHIIIQTDSYDANTISL
jgi:hypothetical protein